MTKSREEPSPAPHKEAKPKIIEKESKDVEMRDTEESELVS
jgi:hypothetical protein